jgi:ubiquinone/menaquinone biosynthesis C-methylase UbiE
MPAFVSVFPSCANEPMRIQRPPRMSPLYRSARLPVLDAVTTVGMLGFDRRVRAEAVRLLGLTPGDQVLELACGTGRTLPLLATHVGDGGIVFGVDKSPALIERARRRVADYGRVELITGDWLEVDIRTTMDAAICVLGLSVIDRWETALDRLLLAVRPGGRLVIVDWLVDGGQSHPLNAYIRLGSWLAQAHPDRRIIAAARSRLARVTSYRLPMGLHLVAGFHA